MGETFIYANLDREEYLDAGLLFQNSKMSGLGEGYGGKALALLLVKRSPGYPDDLYAPPVGSWSENRICTVGDYDSGRYEQVTASFRAIDSSAMLMLFRFFEDELLERAHRDDDLFVFLGELAAVHNQKQVAHALSTTFGESWRDGYFSKRSVNWTEFPRP